MFNIKKIVLLASIFIFGNGNLIASYSHCDIKSTINTALVAIQMSKPETPQMITTSVCSIKKTTNYKKYPNSTPKKLREWNKSRDKRCIAARHNFNTY